jgi:broad specificity phosphatase PhoE
MATRTLYLVRHGQYLAADVDGSEPERLTTLGRRQAVKLAKRLSEVNYDALYTSNMPRAIETADIVARLLPPTPRTSTALLREGLPAVAAHFDERFRPPEDKVLETRQRMDRAFQKFVRPSRKDRNELFIVHGNLIRYLIRKLLDDDATRWWQMDIHQCSLSVVRITPKRGVLVSYNDVGHLPFGLRTHS